MKKMSEDKILEDILRKYVTRLEDILRKYVTREVEEMDPDFKQKMYSNMTDPETLEKNIGLYGKRALKKGILFAALTQIEF